MTRHYHCDGCKRPIEGKYFIELGVRVLIASGEETQDAQEEWAGDYCAICLSNGEALRDMREALSTTHRTLIGVVK